MSSMSYDPIISKWSSIFDVPFALVKAIVRVESNFNPNAKNPASSASGLMQIISGTWKWMGGAVGKIFDPDENVKTGTKYLAFNLKRTDGDPEAAVANYYAGKAFKDESGRWYRVVNGKRNYDVDSYVDKVMSWYRKYSSGSTSSPPQTLPSGETGPLTGGGLGTDTGLLLLAGGVGLLFIKRLFRKKKE